MAILVILNTIEFILWHNIFMSINIKNNVIQTDSHVADFYRIYSISVNLS